MHAIKKIEIKRFRRLRDIELEMRPLMVLVGANGAGKTSFLDALALFSASASGKMRETIEDMGGVSDILTRGSSDALSFGATMEVTGHPPLEYEFSLQAKGQGYSIAKENLSQQKKDREQPFFYINSHGDDIKYYDVTQKKLLPPDWSYNLFETSLSQVPKVYRQPEELRKILGTTTQYHTLDVGRQAPVKLPQQMRPAALPGKNGENLASFLYSLREVNNDYYEKIEDTLHAAFPSFEALSFPPVAAGMLSMTWKEKYFKNPIYTHELSEGTLRFLWLTALLQSPELSPVTMIDEPEVSLHPELLSLLADLLREASKRTQIIVATHSDCLIRFLKPSEVVVMDVDGDGFTQARWADSLNLEEWMRDYTLDELWRMGRIGGRA